jgi:hypothetical protein
MLDKIPPKMRRASVRRLVSSRSIDKVFLAPTVTAMARCPGGRWIAWSVVIFIYARSSAVRSPATRISLGVERRGRLLPGGGIQADESILVPIEAQR